MADTLSGVSHVGAAAPLPSPAVSPPFGVGQQHVGVVLRALPEGGVLAQLHGQHLILEAGLSLTPGNTFVATVSQVTPTLVLQLRRSERTAPGGETGPTALTLVPPSSSALPQTITGSLLSPAQLKSYLTSSQPLDHTLGAVEHLLAQHPCLQELDVPLLQALRHTLAVLRPQGKTPPDAAQLQEHIDRSGLNYENKVERALRGETGAAAALAGDLKGQLLALAQRLEQAVHNAPTQQAQEAAEVLPQVRRALENVEFQQVVNQLAPAEHQPVVLPVPQPFTATTQPVSLAVQRDGHGGGSNPAAPESYTLLLQLDLQGLGPLRIAATVQGSDIATTFQVNAPAIATLIQDAAPELVASLRALGFQTHVACDVQPHVAPESARQVPRVLARSMRLVDVTI